MQKQNDSYQYIKDLVFDIIHRTKGFVAYENVTAEVKNIFLKVSGIKNISHGIEAG
jgi:hypothetical protein